MTLEDYIGVGLLCLVLGVFVFVVGWLIYDWYDTRRLRAQLRCRQEGYERGYLAGKVDGRAEVQAQWTEAEKKRQAEETERKAEEEKKRKGTWQGNGYYMYDPIEIVHTNGEVITLCADQTFSEEELEHIGYDKVKVLLTYKLLGEAASYVDFREGFNPMLMGKMLHARLRVVKVNR